MPAVTLAPSPVSKSNIPSAHSSLPPSPSYQKLGSPANFVLLKTYLIHAPHSSYCRRGHPQSPYLPSTPLSKPPTSLAHGEPSPSSPFGSTSSHPVPSLHVEISPTRSAQSLPIHHNGQDPSSAPVTMSSSSTPMSCLASPRAWEFMAPSQMLVPTFSIGKEWGQSRSGWTTTCSLAYSANTSEYNRRRAAAHQRIEANGGRRQDGSRFWYAGTTLPDGRIEEFDNDCKFPLQDLSSRSSRSPVDARFAYCMADIDELSEELGLLWGKDKDVSFRPL